MLGRSLTNSILIRSCTYAVRQLNFLGKLTLRNYASGDEHDEPKDRELQSHTKPTTLLPGGGLEKLQGGIKEETYFNIHDWELMTKIRDAHGAKLKCENCLDNWTEFQRMLNTNTPIQMRDSGLLCPHKNYNEEAFFLNERKECVKLMQEKLNNIHKINDTNLKIHSNDLETRQSQISSSKMEMPENYTTENLESNESEKNNLNINDNANDDFDEDKIFLEYEPKLSTATSRTGNELQNPRSTNSSGQPPLDSPKQ